MDRQVSASNWKTHPCFNNATAVNFPKPIILHGDASTTGLGNVLLQFRDDKRSHPVCCASHSLKNAEPLYPPSKLAFFALKWVVIDNNPLMYLHKNLN